MKSELKNICDLINEKISANELINNNLASTYVSTESMLPNKRGITKPSSFPVRVLQQHIKRMMYWYQT